MVDQVRPTVTIQTSSQPDATQTQAWGSSSDHVHVFGTEILLAQRRCDVGENRAFIRAASLHVTAQKGGVAFVDFAVTDSLDASGLQGERLSSHASKEFERLNLQLFHCLLLMFGALGAAVHPSPFWVSW